MTYYASKNSKESQSLYERGAQQEYSDIHERIERIKIITTDSFFYLFYNQLNE